MKRVLIVEDEAKDAAGLAALVERYGREKGLELQVQTTNDAATLIRARNPWDLVFLDVDLAGSDYDGMEAATLLRSFDASTPLIFVTGLRQYAVQGYEVGATGFIVKPATWQKLVMAMDKVGSLRRPDGAGRVVISQGTGIRVVPLASLLYVEMQGHDLVYHLDGEETVKVRGAISTVEEGLAEDPVARISSGCVVNLQHVAQVRGNEVRMDDGSVLPLSRSRRQEVRDAFAGWLGVRR